MKFEKFLLDDYLQTPDGKKVFDFFSDFEDIFFHRQTDFFNFVDSFLDLTIAKQFLSLEDPDDHHIRSKNEVLLDRGFFNKIDEFIDKYLSEEEFETNPRQILSDLPFFSILYFLEQPEYAFPYLFPVHFYRFSQICENFDIALPPIPRRTKYLERTHYYFELCRSMYDFRKLHHMTPIELCVFLYGFAPRFFEKYVENELPLPNKIYMVGSSEEDVKDYTSKSLTQKTRFYWQGNDDILPGDIVILYETSPYSRIASIWRAISRGYDDPFHFFPGKVFLGNPIKVPYIEFNLLASDPVWGKKGLVKANMQGLGHIPSITHDEYERLKMLFQKKDASFDLRELPEPPPYAQFYHKDIASEKDVEEKLLEPFLTKLGYDVNKEFTRQFPIRMGRGIRYYPDYALHATGSRGEERADFIWEAKYRIPNQKQLREDYGQAKSYAIRLQTKGFGLVSMEGVKIWQATNYFAFEKNLSFSWEEIENPDILGKLKVFFQKKHKSNKSGDK